MVLPDTINQPISRRIALLTDSDSTSRIGISFVRTGFTLYRRPISHSQAHMHRNGMFTARAIANPAAERQPHKTHTIFPLTPSETTLRYFLVGWYLSNSASSHSLIT